MNEHDVRELLEVLKITYPATYRGMTPKDVAAIINLYLKLFGRYDKTIVARALENYIRVNQYPPTPAGIFEQIDFILGKETPAELWNALFKQLGNSLYHQGEAFRSLPAACQRWLGSSSALREIALLDADVVTSVIRGEFLQSIGAIVKSDEAQRTLPAEVRIAIEGYQQNLFEVVD